MNDLFLRALQGKSVPRPPVWLMRQAGRYLPEYKKIRAKYSLAEAFHEPEIAAEITLLPCTLLNVDAAILFSDILVIAEALGLKVHFPENKSPYVTPVVTKESVDFLPTLPVDECLSYVPKTISLLLPELKVPLIGFSGAPFTVASYFIEGESSKGALPKTKEWLYTDPASFHKLLTKITAVTIDYLKLQIKAGVQAIQIFDSWANVLSYPHFLEFSAAYLKKIVEAIRPSNIPVILFCRGSSSLAKELSSLEPTAISFDWQKEMKDLRKEVPSAIAIQGNLDPDLLRGSRESVVSHTKHLLDSMKGQKSFIANLGHGVLPDTPVDNVKAFVATILAYGSRI